MSAAAILCALGCETRTVNRGNGGDAAVERPGIDAGSATDAVATPPALDFAATGCASVDLGAPRCLGTAPLALLFTPISSEGLTRFLWDFGDGTEPSSERSPRHRYTLPGRYTVTLVAGGSAGTLSRLHDGYATVVPAPVGDRCDVDQQCRDGQRCFCGTAAPCLPVITGGLCASDCGGDTSNTCPAGARCAALAPPLGAADDAGAPEQAWRRAVCLRTCDADHDCAPGLGCRPVPLWGGAAQAGWGRFCFVAYPGAVGDRCADALGNRAADSCITGECAQLGAHGRCTRTCSSASDCPVGAACARFGDGRTICLADCGGTRTCDDDPSLACEGPGGVGPLSFVLIGVAGPADGGAGASGTYCAPRRCASSPPPQDDSRPCGTGAICLSGHCVGAPAGPADAAAP